MRFLIDMGGDVNSFDCRGRAPLHEAIRTKSTTSDRSIVVSELLLAGAGVNLPTPLGVTALHYAVWYGHLGVLNTLLRHDANPLFGHDKEERTACGWAEYHVAQSNSGSTGGGGGNQQQFRGSQP
jgi:ankyrin repeat protein